MTKSSQKDLDVTRLVMGRLAAMPHKPHKPAKKKTKKSALANNKEK
jgi:hypothetical protein